ncbi:MAG: hypothetical protein AAFO99_09025 [Bacteroidota bacterium]
MKKICLIALVMLLNSCAGGKYTYLFDTGKQLDFSKGKWLLNRTESNSKIFDAELYQVAFKGFKEILGDSLIDMHMVRTSKLVAPKIGFELTKTELEKLKKDSDCDFLINIAGTVVSNGAGTLSTDSGNGYYSASNRSSVTIMIYDLNARAIVSSSQAFGKATSENSHFDNGNGIPTINSSAETLMVAAAKKLIKKYDTYRLD